MSAKILPLMRRIAAGPACDLRPPRPGVGDKSATTKNDAIEVSNR